MLQAHADGPFLPGDPFVIVGVTVEMEPFAAESKSLVSLQEVAERSELLASQFLPEKETIEKITVAT